VLREPKTYARAVWRSLDHPDGKMGITVRAFGVGLVALFSSRHCASQNTVQIDESQYSIQALMA
jgi:hypothetical protein